MTYRLILGTRGSKLALAQSEMIAAQLRAAHPGLTVELCVITTKGDRILDVALSAVGDKGLFVKELEQALIDHEVDFCVHSCKDLPSVTPAELTLAAFPERADPRDILVIKAEGRRQAEDEADRSAFHILHAAFPSGARVGTSSLRRACQLRTLRPDLELRDVRGNVDTRLRKLAEGQYDALILAAAGLDRLGMTAGVADGEPFSAVDHEFVAWRIPPSLMLPAVAQGVLAIECRADDTRTIELLSVLDHRPSRDAALAERALLRRLEGGCQVPIAAFAECKMQNAKTALAADRPTVDLLHSGFCILHLQGLVGSLDGATVVRGERRGAPEDAELLGSALAEDLLAQGAAEILGEIALQTGKR